MSCDEDETPVVISRFYSYQPFDEYLLGASNIESSEINHIDIDWISGNIHIDESSGTTINFHEIIDSGVDNKYKMHYMVSNKTLYIKYIASIDKFAYNFQTKDLYVKIPLNYTVESITINSVDANSYINKLNCNTLTYKSIDGNFETSNTSIKDIDLKTSGIITMINTSNKTLKIKGTNPNVLLDIITMDKLTINTNSGLIKVKQGNMNTITIQSISSTIDLGITNPNTKVQIETYNSHINFSISPDSIFLVNYDTSEGVFSSNLPYSRYNNKYTSPNRSDNVETSIDINVRSSTGTIEIKNNQ